MADLAAKTLVTSKGTIKAGAQIPDGLDKDELSRIRKAGGIALRAKAQPVADAKSDK